MDITVTGFCKATRKNAFIRIAVNDSDKDRAYAAAEMLGKIYGSKAKNALSRYGVDSNRIKIEKASEKGDAALMFEVPIDNAEEFLKDPFFKGILNAAATQVFKCGYNFDESAVLNQIESPSQEDAKNANSLTNDFIKSLFSRLDDPKIQQFLKSYCGNIKIYSTDSNGWEHMQYSPRNIAMIYAQYEPMGITPTFICSAREWAKCFNRKIKDGEKGVVIEIPEKNKRFDAQAYYDKTSGRDYNTDFSAQGATKLMALRGGHNQNDDVQGQPFYPGWVYDITQTELMKDRYGNDLPDYFNDTTIQRPNNILDLSQGYVLDPNQGTIIKDTSTGKALDSSPLDVNQDKIPQGLKNIREGMENPKFQGMFAQLVPMVEQALSTPNVQSMEKVINELAKIQCYQIDIKGGKKEQYANIARNIIMAGMGYGDINQVAAYARLVQQEKQYNYKECTKVFNVVRNITMLLNGVMKESIMNEEICKEFSFEDILNIMGLENENVVAENKKNIKKEFDNIFNKIKK